jgi:hypothetical protein
MKAFFVHDKQTHKDVMVVPEIDSLVTVDRKVMEEFIAVAPDFSKFSGECLNKRAPENIGQVVATRKADMDVCIIEKVLWQQRMAFYLDGAG